MLYNVPLLIEESRLESIVAAEQAGADPGAFLFFMREPERDLDIRDGIAVIPIRGGLFNFRLERIQRQVRQAVADASVKAILFDIDSPGGTVQTTFDLADEIFEARQAKPLWAIANDDAFSAAYALGSSAHRLFVTRTGGVGSVGVIAVHVEFSKMDARMGVKFTEIISGARKKDFSDAEPLNPTARRLLQAEVDRLREIFIETVARNRGLSDEAVSDTEAGVYFGPNGIGGDVGFADGVATFDVVFEDLKTFLATPRTSAAAAADHTAEEAAMADDPKKGAEAAAPGSEVTSTPAPTAAPAAPAAASAAAPAAAPEAANVVSIDSARQEGREAERKATQERQSAIRMHCQLAGCPERFGEFLDSDLTAAQVGQKLLEERNGKGGDEISGHHAETGSPDGPVIDTSAIYRRWNDPAALAAGAQKEV